MVRYYLINVDLARLASTLGRRVEGRQWTEAQAETWLRESGLTRAAGGWLCNRSPSEFLDRRAYALLDRYVSASSPGEC